MNFSHIIALIRKDWILEWRSRYALGSILLYVISSVYVLYAAAMNVSGPLWNVLFWIVVLFSGINAVVKSFVHENSSRQLYYYQITEPASVFVAKALYNSLLLLVIIALTAVAMGFLAGWPIIRLGAFVLSVIMAALGFAVALTMIAGIAAKSHNTATLMPILCFPLIIPILATLIKMNTVALGLTVGLALWREVAILAAIDIILFALAIVLFPYLWRD